MYDNNFDGVFKFTNASDDDFTVMWNSKEYTFPAQSTCPMIMPEFTLEEVQEIRKKFAKKLAWREFFKSKEGKALEKDSSKHLTPAGFDEKLLEPYIEQCLSPLPISNVSVKVVPKKKPTFIENGTVVLDEQKSLVSMSKEDFSDYVPPVLGKMTD